MTSLEGRDGASNLGCGCLGGALAAVVGMGAFLAVLFVAEDTPATTQEWLDTGEFTLKFVALATLFVSPFGAAAGLLIGVIDNLVDGRLHDERIPFWVWLPVGIGAGAVSSTVLLKLLMGAEYTLAQCALVGGVCGLVAGPIFGWLYRERTQPNPA